MAPRAVCKKDAQCVSHTHSMNGFQMLVDAAVIVEVPTFQNFGMGFVFKPLVD